MDGLILLGILAFFGWMLYRAGKRAGKRTGSRKGFAAGRSRRRWRRK